MNDEDSKFVASGAAGLLGFLVSHIFARMTKKDDKHDEGQNKLSTDTQLLQARVARLEEDLREAKRDLASHLREHGRHRDD